MADDYAKKELSQARALIERVLSSNQRARNDDKWLIFSVWALQGCDLMTRRLGLEDIPTLFNPETIIRLRAQIQNKEGRFIPTAPDIALKRRIKEETYRAEFGRGFYDG